MSIVRSRAKRTLPATVRRTLVAAALLVISVTAWPSLAVAHEPYDINGVIVSLTSKAIEVRTKDRELVSLIIEPDTRVTRDKKTVTLADLKVGMEVSVHAIGHSLADASAREIVVARSRGRK
jgi:hypothetical protein